MAIGDCIKSIRKEKRITQKQLSNLSGLAEITIRQYEANKYVPKADNLQKIATALGVRLSEFLEPGQIIKEYNPDHDEWNILTKKVDGTVTQTFQTSITHNTFQPSLEQQIILKYFNALNSRGRKEAIKRIEELSLISKYNTTQEPPTNE